MRFVGDNKRNSNRLLANAGRPSLLLQHSVGRRLLRGSRTGYSPGGQAHPLA
jgi:hypothetical protein